MCFSSRLTAGAWKIRAKQISALRTNWEAIAKPTAGDLDRFDMFCFTKRPDLNLVEKVRATGKPVILDIVDGWAQPEDGIKCADISAARELFSGLWSKVGADGYIFPTETMRRDLGDLVHRSVTIYHHYYPLLKKNPLREHVRTVGFVGKGLGEWRTRIKKICAQRGISFVVNPREFTDMDIVILVRGGRNANFLAKRYKSNVKLANAYASGTPALVHTEEMSSHDTDNGSVVFFNSEPGSLERQLDLLVNDTRLRKRISTAFLQSAEKYAISTIAEEFERFFLLVAKEKAGLTVNR